MNEYIASYLKYFEASDDVSLYYAPGRVNLIGEHIDYNGGFVLPAAISIGTFGVVGKRSDQKLCMVSKNENQLGVKCFHMTDLSYLKADGWTNYVKGILFELIQSGYAIPFGFNLYIEGNLPTASGLSSSASLEVLVAYIANDLYVLNISRTDLALLAQKVENEYMGMHCGIMDQLIIANGIKDHALLMDTSTLSMTATPAAFDGHQLLIMNTNYQRKTTESKYNERVLECQQALSIIQKHHQINHLCALNVSELNGIEEMLNQKTLYQRVRHTVTEQQRTLHAMVALKNKNPILFGKLLTESHHSLKNDYEVTGYHLDVLVESAMASGALGARVTGAGFGGCAIALVKDEDVTELKKAVHDTYIEKTGIRPDFYSVKFSDGVHKINHV